MGLNLLKKLNERTINIIDTIIQIMIKTVIVSLILCLIFGAIGQFTNLSFMISLAGVCFFTFFISIVVLITVTIILLSCFIIYVIKRDGIKKLLKRLIPSFTISFIILIIIYFIKHKKLEWIEAVLYSLPITLSWFSLTEIIMLYKEMKQEYTLNVFNKNDTK